MMTHRSQSSVSENKAKFKATIRLGFSVGKCAGTIDVDGTISSEECYLKGLFDAEGPIHGIFPNFLFNKENKCLGSISIGASSCNYSASYSFKYPHPIKPRAIATAEEKKRQELAKRQHRQKSSKTHLGVRESRQS